MNDPIDLVDLDDRVSHLRDDTARLAACLETGDLDAPVAACPGWDLRRLAVHVGGVHRWATTAIQEAGPPSGRGDRPDEDIDGAQLAAWLRVGGDVLADVLAATHSESPTWHPFPAEQIAWIWSRRLMIETALHRWDAETAVHEPSVHETSVSEPSTIHPAVAAVGIGEYFHLGVPRILESAGLPVPAPSLHLHCTDDSLPDGAGEWIVENDDGQYRVEAEHRHGDAALRGRSDQILLVLHGRADRSTLDIVGDSDAAAAWLDLPGW